MVGLIGSALGALEAVFRFLDTQASRKYVEEIIELRLKIQEEEAKGYYSDDAKIESLNKKLKVYFDAASQEIAIKTARGA